MPRDGSNVYHYPTGIEGAPDTVVKSAPYNSFLADVEQDLNAPRPILAGGTAATSTAGAIANLGAEKSKQGPVTNYDTFPWVNGSFSSDAGATGAPTAGIAYTGTYYEHINPLYATIEARSISDGALYVRQKNGGVWGAWVRDVDAATGLMVAGRQTTTGGFRFTTYNAGTFAAGTFTPDAYNGNYQYLANAGAHNWSVPTSECAIDILVGNASGSGVISFTGGWIVGAGKTGDALTATPGHSFIISIRKILSVATYVIKALQ